MNVTDNQTAVVRFCSMAAAKILLEMGMEPVMQMVTRDMNRIGLQSNILGAAAMGIKNLLCLTGDHQSFGDHPQAKNVHDMDSVMLAHTVQIMRDEGKMISGTEVDGPAPMFIGAAANPFADPQEFRVVRMGKKINAGVQFIQTQCIYNMERFKKFMEMANDMGLTEKCYIMAGITPLKSVGMANYMKKFVPGLDVPDSYITRLKGVPKDKVAAEGIKIAVEQIQRVPGDEGRRRHPSHGHRVGREGPGDSGGGQTAPAAQGGLADLYRQTKGPVFDRAFLFVVISLLWGG